MTHTVDTIFALSSGKLPAGVAVIRVSGPRAFSVCAELAGSLPPARKASLRAIRTADGELIDEGVVLTFPAPSSFTGEDCVEFQVHGSRAGVAALLRELGGKTACRMAEPGEFSRRAFENGKVDLVEIEGLADLLVAETEMQRKQAVEQASGHLSALYNRWRETLLRARALIEAELDFADEEDIPGAVSDRIWPQLAALRDEVSMHIDGADRGEVVREGYSVVLTGPPNSGKSTLLNALASREVAIVTDVAGTTRDIISCDLDLGGYLVRCYDTAGLRETDDIIELEGIRRAREALGKADLILSLNDAALPPVDEASTDSIPIRNIGTKLDSVAGAPDKGYDLLISARSGEGLRELRDLIIAHIENGRGSASLVPSRIRQVQHLKRCEEWLKRAADESSLNLEVRAEFIRQAADELGAITGRIDTETLLGAIFGEFCVGK